LTIELIAFTSTVPSAPLLQIAPWILDAVIRSASSDGVTAIVCFELLVKPGSLIEKITPVHCNNLAPQDTNYRFIQFFPFFICHPALRCGMTIIFPLPTQS